MSNRLPISGEYPPDWDQIGDRVRAEAGHRCIRCGHPFKTGEHGKGEWTPCDERCTHAGPLIGVEPEWLATPEKISRAADLLSEMPGNPLENTPCVPKLLAARPPLCTKIIVARWRILTVHHLDGNKANCEWWNTLSLCQRCHLQIQTRVNPEIPYFLEHSAWFRPYVAGFYAKKYEGKLITREEAVARMDELLAYERLA